MKILKRYLPVSPSYLLFSVWGGFLLYIWPRMFFETREGIFAGERSIWADWACHLAGSSAFAFLPQSMWFENHPQFYGQTYNYPFLSSMISGILMRLGIDRISAFIIPSIIISLLLLVILYCFYEAIFKSKRQAWLAVSLFFLCGGLGFFYYIQDMVRSFSWDTLLFPVREYTFLEDKRIFFRNIFPSELLPQRSFLLGLPVGLSILAALTRWLCKEPGEKTFLRYGVAGIPAGLLIIIHTHSYIAMVILCFCLAAFNLKRYKEMVVFALSAGLMSLWLYTTFHGQFAPSKWFGLEWGWMSNNQGDGILSFVKFWLMNWGLMLPLAVWGTIQMRHYQNPLVIGGWVLFILCNIFRFQPWNWDNSKLLTWSYLLLVIPVVGVLSFLWRGNRIIVRGVAIVLIGFLTFSGGLELMRLVQSDRMTHRMWEKSKIDMALNFQKILKPEETVLTDDDHLNWVSSLSGGQILMGYRGWLWSWGIDYSEREKDIRRMYSGKPGSENLFQKYHVRYAVLSPSARDKFQANEMLFLLKYKMIMKDGDTRVYDVKTPRNM